MPIMNDKDLLSVLISYKERLQVALKVARICIFEVDLTRQLYSYFENSEEIFGVRGEDILKDVQKFSDLSPEEYQKQHLIIFLIQMIRKLYHMLLKVYWQVSQLLIMQE